ncbi:response regulator transcription factor [Nannocystis bainbridge]|uniref:Response regulator transcription factor n=1 Tax=Nannocystis bainbridge TaxID=2995303 RepID=A0ABT5DRI2_9BACT|nr:response regulator transcription factor [Nannocystis bainbridge]MDC0715738.1 response regulator transcription factor [Nannocystis bainbridge]
MQTPAKVLLIEDDVRLAERTAEYLQGHELAVEVAGDGETGLARALSGEHDVILLDLMLPRLDGLEVCRRLRQRSALPVIMLSARSEEIDRILGLELGADDYLPKPYSPRELVARIRAVLRRAVPSPEGPASTLRCGPLVVDRARRRVEVAGGACDLTAHQFDLLWLLLEARGQVLSREQLYQRLRALRGQPPGTYDPSVDRSIDVQLSKIRGTLAAADPHAAGLIRTVRGVGYVLDDSPEGPA